MGATKRLLTFAGGGLVGATVGAVVAALIAPQSGNDLQRNLRKRVQLAKVAGVEARAAKEEELIRRFRGRVNDPDALEEERVRARAEVAAAVQAVGLGRNAPGAIAAQDLQTDR
jgi:hypothetical protein